MVVVSIVGKIKCRIGNDEWRMRKLFRDGARRSRRSNVEKARARWILPAAAVPCGCHCGVNAALRAVVRLPQASSPASSGGVSPPDSMAGARTPRQLAAEDIFGAGAVVRRKVRLRNIAPTGAVRVRGTFNSTRRQRGAVGGLAFPQKGTSCLI